MGTERLARRLVSGSPAATEALGEVLGRRLPAGSVVALAGELGTGKTCFVRGLARGLGIEDGVASPTFTLMQAHEGGRLPLFHFDAWMEGRQKALFLDGGDEWLYAGGVAVVEWADRVAEWLPLPRLELTLSHAGPGERVLELAWIGPEGGPGDDPEGEQALRGLVEDLELPPGIRVAQGRAPETR